MYSKYRLQVAYDPSRKISDIQTDINNEYIVRIVPVVDLSLSFGEYAKNFYSAATKIAEFLLESDDSDACQMDSFFFPLAFLYRHSIELYLKGIAFRYILDRNARKDFAKKTFHNLEIILDEVLKLAKCSRPSEEILWLTKYLHDISNKDRESDSFRYPFHICQNSSSGKELHIVRVFEEQKQIDLVEFVNKFEASIEILELWYDGDINQATMWKEFIPQFIEEGGGYYGQSIVGYKYQGQDFYPYVSSYVEAAGFLRNEMKMADDEGNSDVANKYFFPMCYLYRNCVELVVKAAWFEDVRADFQLRCKALLRKKHSISGLWNKLSEWIIDYYGEGKTTAEYFNEIKIGCDELQGFDSDASKFRYPCNKEMQPYFKKTAKFDYMNIAKFMEGLIYAIHGVELELAARSEYIDETKNHGHQCEYWETDR